LGAEEKEIESGGGGGIGHGLNEEREELAFHGMGKVRR
jgi:hypothetical protein